MYVYTYKHVLVRDDFFFFKRNTYVAHRLEKYSFYSSQFFCTNIKKKNLRFFLVVFNYLFFNLPFPNRYIRVH